MWGCVVATLGGDATASDRVSETRNCCLRALRKASRAGDAGFETAKISSRCFDCLLPASGEETFGFGVNG